MKKDAAVAAASPKDNKNQAVANQYVPDRISTNAEAFLVIVCDVTGSFEEWPQTIFSKLPYLEHEAKEYLGQNLEISFAAVGDAFKDRYPLQVKAPCHGVQLKESLEKFVIEKGGGANHVESYDLPALYYARKCDMPNVIRKPIMIFICDEGIYNFVDHEKAEKYCGVKLDKHLANVDLFAELKKKFSVYAIRKPYGCDGFENNLRHRMDVAIEEQWADMIGADHIVDLPEASRVVDVIFGILASETNRLDYFDQELQDRQGKDKDGNHKINVVQKSLLSIRQKPVARMAPGHMKSLTNRPDDSRPMKSLSLLD